MTRVKLQKLQKLQLYHIYYIISTKINQKHYKNMYTQGTDTF